MNKKSNLPLRIPNGLRPRTMQVVVTGLISLLYALFWRWYTGPQKPLTPVEIETYLQKTDARGANSAALEYLRNFLQADTGHSFVMLNLIKLHDQPQFAPKDQPVSGTSMQILNRYSSRFLPDLLKRAGHPIMQGTVAAKAFEVWGISDGEDWTQAALVRYRSRRDMIAAATASHFSDIHGFKIAAMEKTIAVPLDPWMHLGDPRLIIGLIALLGIALTNYPVQRGASQ